MTKKFTVVFLLTLILMACIFTVAGLLPPKAGLTLVIVSILFLSAAAFAKAVDNKIISLMLVAGMASFVPVAKAQENRGDGEVKAQWVMEVVVGIGILAVGSYIVYKLYKLIDRALPPAKTPPPAPPPYTNAPGQFTNSAPTNVIRTLTMSDDGVSAWDISHYSTNDPAFSGPDGLAYTKYFTFTLMSGSQPESLTHDCEVSGWISPTHIITVMRGVFTNRSRLEDLETRTHFAGDNRNGRADPPARFYRTK